MNVFSIWIRRRSLIAFYLICFGFSWCLWLPYLLTRVQIFELLAVPGLFGPAIAAVTVARFSMSPADRPATVPFWLSFMAAWMVSTLAWFLYTGNSAPAGASPFPVIWIFSALFALVPAYILASTFSGSTGVRRAFSSLTQPGGRWHWYVLALSAPLAIRLASMWLSRQLGWATLTGPCDRRLLDSQ